MEIIKRVLITGASGYIASNLTRRLAENGAEVHIIVRPHSKLDILKDIQKKINIHVFDGGISKMLRIVNTVKPECIFHLAALFIVEHKPEEIKDLLDSNLLFGTQLLEAASAAGVKYFINAGTHWQHYNTGEYCPSNLYAATKQAFQTIARYYISAFDMRFVTVKLIDTYGPFDPRSKVLSLLKKIAVNGESLDMSGGEQQLGFLYIDDVVTAFIKAAEYADKMPPHAEDSFIAAPKEIYGLREAVSIFESAYNIKLNIRFGKRLYKEREVMKICCADENILADVETVELYDGLKKIIGLEQAIRGS